MKQDQPQIKQHTGCHRRYHHFTFTKALHVVAGEDHRRNLQAGGGAHQDPGQTVGKPEIAADPQRHINDIHGVAGPHQGGGDKQHPHILVLPAAGLRQRLRLFRGLFHARNRGQFDRNQRQADRKDARRNREHGGKAIVERQHKGQRRANHPRQRQLGTHDRAEHHHFPRRAVGIFPRQGKELRHGGVSDGCQHHPAGDQRQIVAVEGKQQRIAYRHQTAEHN